jgi:hypothetical protein
MGGRSTGCAEVLQRNPLDAAPADSRGLERDVQSGELGMRGKPAGSGGVYATSLLVVDHLERVAEHGAALRLHLDHDEASPTPQDEVELVASDSRVGRDQAVSTEPVVAERAALAAVHAASSW